MTYCDKPVDHAGKTVPCIREINHIGVCLPSLLDGYNGLQRTKPVCKHDWRMFTREPKKEMHWKRNPFVSDPFAYNYYEITFKNEDYKELWYCIKCRHEETRIVPDVR